MYKNKTVLSLFSSAGIGELGIKKLGLQILVKNICGDIWKNKKRL